MNSRGQAQEGHTLVDGETQDDDIDYIPGDEFLTAGRAVTEEYSELMRRLAR